MYNKSNSELNLPIKMLDSSIATWDMFEHFPVPTTAFILSRTGINLAQEEKNESGAKLAATRYSRLVKQMMENNISDENDRKINEYFLSRFTDRASTFILAVCEMVQAHNVSRAGLVSYQHGLDIGITADDVEKAADITAVIRTLRNGDMFLNNYNHIIPTSAYRVGY